MKKVRNKLAGKGPKLAGKGPTAGRNPEEEAARQLEAARRETAERLGGSRMDPGVAPPTQRQPAAPPPQAPPAQSAPREFLGAAPPAAPPGGQTFGTPPSAGGAITSADERRAITDMALEDLQRQRQAAASAENPSVVRPARIPEDEFERRRPPAPGESLPGVPPPHIPSEDLRDQALREILERKERLDREYRERQAALGQGPPVSTGPKTKLHGLAKKKQALAKGAASQPAPAPTPRPEPASTTTTGESVEEALAGIKGVGPVIRSALAERFNSVEEIREADPEELTEVNGVGPALASRIKTSL